MKPFLTYNFKGTSRCRTRVFCEYLVIAIVVCLSLSLCGWAQSSDQSSSSQSQASQKPDQTPPEAGGPGGEVGPMAVPKKTDSADDTPPPPKPKKQPDIPEYSLHVEVPVVTVDARVVMKDGRPLALPPNVAKDHFKIWEDGVPQKIQTVTQSEAPITAVLLVEFAAANYNFMYDAMNASYMFAANLKPIDWVAVIQFDMKSHILVDFTQDKQAIFGALNTLRIPTFSETNLWDAMYDTLDRLDRIQGHKELVIVASGRDTMSHMTFDKILKKVKSTPNVTIYTITTSRRCASWRKRATATIQTSVPPTWSTSWLTTR